MLCSSLVLDKNLYTLTDGEEASGLGFKGKLNRTLYAISSILQIDIQITKYDTC